MFSGERSFFLTSPTTAASIFSCEIVSVLVQVLDPRRFRDGHW
nr:hypothetical protein [Anaeromyxobacter sp. SG26]